MLKGKSNLWICTNDNMGCKPEMACSHSTNNNVLPSIIRIFQTFLLENHLEVQIQIFFMCSRSKVTHQSPDTPCWSMWLPIRTFGCQCSYNQMFDFSCIYFQVVLFDLPSGSLSCLFFSQPRYFYYLLYV